MREEEDETEHVSKSQRKREVQAVANIGERLTELSDEHLSVLPYEDVLIAIKAFRKIRKGNARKRQLQYIGKLLRRVDTTPAIELLERYDASSKAHVLQFHQLEDWRERLLDNDPTIFSEIAAQHPEVDRQQLTQLARKAIAEKAEDRQPPVYFRQLFQFLKKLG